MARVSINGHRDPAEKSKDEDERRFARELTMALSGQQRRVFANLNSLSEFFWQDETNRMVAVVSSNLDRMAMAGAHVAVQQTPLAQKGLADLHGDVLEWVTRYAFDLVSGITSTTRKVVQVGLQRFVSQPDYTLRMLKDSLAPTFGMSRAQTISVTEVTRAYAVGADRAQRRVAEEGIKTVKVWKTLYDEKVCPICQPLDELKESPEGGFNPSGGFGIPYPPAHPNCRCFTILEPL
jgi:hypothetical protein